MWAAKGVWVGWCWVVVGGGLLTENRSFRWKKGMKKYMVGPRWSRHRGSHKQSVSSAELVSISVRSWMKRRGRAWRQDGGDMMDGQGTTWQGRLCQDPDRELEWYKRDKKSQREEKLHHISLWSLFFITQSVQTEPVVLRKEAVLLELQLQMRVKSEKEELIDKQAGIKGEGHML